MWSRWLKTDLATFPQARKLCPKSGRDRRRPWLPRWANSCREQLQQSSPYSITSSALASKLAGTVRPSALAVLRFAAPRSPTPERDESPYRLDDTEGPRPLQEAIGRAKCARDGEPENEPRVPVLASPWGAPYHDLTPALAQVRPGRRVKASPS
jgi:hypothetical protein